METKKPRKTRTDSAAAAIEAAKNATLPVQMPPPHVQISADAMPYYEDIFHARARAEWNPHQLTVAAQIAECMAKQVEIEAMLLIEGLVVEGTHGPKPNPLVGILERMAARQQALSRSIQLVGRSLGDPRANNRQRQLEAGAREAHTQTKQEDNLLA
jgi:hypothetical protein